MSVEIIYEDDSLLVVNKPSGLLTIPAPGKNASTLTDILNADAVQKGLSYRFHPCHRLDRDTSGLIIYAKGKAVQKVMMDLFRQKKVRKKYIAFVQGGFPASTGHINYPIEGIPAETDYRVQTRKKEFSVVELVPVTGRTNQLRIHCKHIGHPILGERKFAFGRDFTLKAKRLCLHAQSLTFAHPVSGKDIKIGSELPEYFHLFLKEHD
jgi:RluA family pseudouridine synthase